MLIIDHIVELGKTLAAEQQQDCQNAIVDGGVEQMLLQWDADTGGATLKFPALAHVRDLLTGYATLSHDERQAQLQQALEALRAFYREYKAQQSDAVVDAAIAAAGDGDGASTSEPPQPKPTKRRTTSRSKKSEPPTDKPLSLTSPIKDIPSIGRANIQAFKRLGVNTVEDMLYHFPHRYDDYSTQKRIAMLTIGETETVVGMIAEVKTFPLKRPGSVGIDVLLEDETGTLKVVFFGAHWLQKQFVQGRKIVVSGKVMWEYGILQMRTPDWEPYNVDELLHTGRLVPVHPLSRGLHERNARQIIKTMIDQMTPKMEDHLPARVLERTGLMPLSQAIAQIHFPDTPDMLQQARRRLGFDEFLFIQLGVVQRKILWQQELGFALEFFEEVHEDLLRNIPFSLTGAQVRILEEIFSDLQRWIPMARLLQGDVGSGKTIVAAAALLQAIANGLQGALMAPTEILAEQHYRGLKTLLGKVRVPRDKRRSAEAETQGGDWKEEQSKPDQMRLAEIKELLGMTPEEDMEGEGVRVALLTGSLGKKDRRHVLAAIANGDVDLVIGTHALITESVQYHGLGLVCVDEQHRFGVEQRERLKQKGINPHMLVMTATPIPRTLTLTIYGELETSILDELPPGRQEIKTRWIRQSERYKAYRHIRKEIEKGRQAYVICPLVEESDKVDLPSAEEMHTTLQHEVFRDFRIGLIHGRLLPREKDEVMRAFADHDYDILVATAVVEVGIDVPNATTIVIDGAERFGLAQLHQFRGRVGRGIHQSYCILVSDMENDVTTKRLEAMETTFDGFQLAEIDLNLRGPGEFFGKRQSGTPDLKVAQLSDVRLLEVARTEAQKILAEDPTLARAEHKLLREKVQHVWEQVEGAS